MPHYAPNSQPSPYAAAWDLAPTIDFVNHGSFGACPRAILDLQTEFRQRMEAEPVRFLVRELPALLDSSRAVLAGLLGIDPAELAFVRNVTEAVNAVLRSLTFAPGDEILVTNHGYNACRNVVDYVCRQTGAGVVVVSLPLEIRSPEEIVEAVLRAAGPRTRLALLDHVTSATALVYPIGQLVRELDRRGIDTLVDGAHAPGMLSLDLATIGAAYYAGNCHKWLCSPKGAGFLHARPDRREAIQPPVISHGFNTRRPEQSAFHAAFDWTGTDDPSPWLCVGPAIRWLDDLMEDGLVGLMQRNHALAIRAREILCRRLGLEPPCPEGLLGAMAAVRLPASFSPRPLARHEIHPLQTRLLEEFGFEVPVYDWPSPHQPVLRVSAQAYNAEGQYTRLAAALAELGG